MESTEKAISVLNDLIEINNDRSNGFEKAIEDLGEGNTDLKAVFEKLAQESKKNSLELASAVQQHGAEAESGTSATGAIHRAWIDVKATFTGHDRKSVLQECERGEDAIKKAYQTALEPDSGLSGEFTQLVSGQQPAVIAGHNQIQALRDSQ